MNTKGQSLSAASSNSAPSQLPESACNLFRYSCKHVNQECVEKHCPGDPGYLGYVREWSRILREGEIPHRVNFEISETASLTMWGGYDHPESYLRFRCFTNSVALPLMCFRRQEIAFDLNYPLVSLLTDAIVLQDKRLLTLLKPAYEDCHHMCVNYPGYLDEVLPWPAFSLTLLAACRGDEREISRWAEQTVVAEAALRKSNHGFVASDTFLFGVTNFDSLFPLWLVLTDLLLPAYRKLEPAALILDAIADCQFKSRSKGSPPLLNEKHLRVFRS